jgi:hypothetical protein
MQTFVDRQSQWTMSGALEIEVKQQSDDVYRFLITPSGPQPATILCYR